MDTALGRKENILQFYTFGEVLGSGSFSEVRLCTENATGKQYAVKIISKEGNTAEEERMHIITTEIKILKAVKHKNIVNLKDVFEDNTTFYIVMEKISGGELFDKIVELSHYSEKDASLLIAQIVRGVQELHNNRIVHRDLKPENLLLASSDPNSDIKITDFGLSEIFPLGTPLLMYKAVGTPGYLAPEVLTLLDNGVPYSKEIDLWGIGVILYILLCGFPPFYGDDEDEMYDKIIAGQWEFISPYWDNVSDQAKDLISKLLVLSPKNRFTCEQALSHPWIINPDNLSEAHLNDTIIQLKKYNARRKFKGAINAVKALARFQNKFKIAKK